MKFLSIPTFSVRRPISTMMFFIALLMWGIISFTQIPVELLPNTSFNHISVLMNIRGGMPPQEVEKLITIPMEEAFATIPRLKSLQSTSKEGRATVILSFPTGTDMDIVSLDVSEKYDQIKNDLPREVERPVIAKYEQNDVPILILALSSKTLSVEDLREQADNLVKPTLQRVKGIANVEVSGGREKKIVIDVNESLLLSRRLTLDQMTRAISKNNLNLLSGDVEVNEKKILLRTEALYQNLDEVKNTVVFSQDTRITIGDVADVSYQYIDQSTLSRINGHPVVSLYLQKESEANTVSVAGEVLKNVNTLKHQLPSGIEWEIVSNQATFIVEALDQVKSALLEGGFFAVLVLFFFLRSILSTLIISLAIPISVLITLGLMHFYNISMNIMSLSGLALGIGMLMDNSIVVMENISRKMEQGFPKDQACIEGTQGVFLSLIASTFATLIVFLPIVFVNPQTRILYGGLALTVTFSLLASLLIAVSLVPSLFARGSAIYKGKKHSLFSRFLRDYKKMLFFALKNRYPILAAVISLLLISLLYLSFIEKDISENADEGKFTVFVELKSGAKLEKSDTVVKQVEKILESIPEIENQSSKIEGWSSKVYVSLKPIRVRTTTQILEDVRQKIEGLGEKEQAFVYTSSGKSAGATEVTIDLYGYQYPTLLDLSSQISNVMKELGGFFDFKLRYKPGRPEMVFRVKKERASLFGFSTKQIADAVHAKIRGLQATKIFQQGKEVETIIRLQEDNRKTLKEVMQLELVSPETGEKIPLSEIVDFKEGLAPSEIWHVDKARMIQVSASTTKYTLARAIELLGPKLRALKLPEDYRIEFGNDYQEMKQTYQNLQWAVILMLFLVYMLLASLFESYIQPLLIMIAVPLALIGVSLAIFFSIQKITLGVLIGVIMLGGIVVNNSIVLLDQWNHLKAEGHEALRAIILAAQSRLRPILMTTSCTVLGLTPLALSSSSSSNLWSPLALTVIGGLLSSTFLTLFVIPMMIVVIRDFKMFLRGTGKLNI